MSKHARKPRDASSRSRRAFVMVFVLGCVAMITVLAIGAVGVNRTRLRTVHAANQGTDAQARMTSSFEMGSLLLQADPNGFTFRDADTFAINEPAAPGRPLIQLSDPDDARLTVGPNDRLRLVATGYDGQAIKRMQADFVPDRRALPALEHALVVTGTRSSSVIRSIAGTEFNAASYHPGDVGTAVGNPYVLTGVNGLLVPGPEVVSLWASYGTVIDVDVFPSRTANRRLFAPMINPVGAGNARGIYVIDCENKSFTLENSRVLGTLILINVGSGSVIKDTSMEALPGQPTLLVRGNIELDFEVDEITENGNATNFNPVNAPYLGATNTDQTDSYPAGIQGIAFVSGNVLMKSALIQGTLIIDGNLAGSGWVRAVVQPQPALVEGFTDVTAWRLVPGSMQALSN